MSRSIVVIVGATAALTALVGNSVLVYATGGRPVIFDGPLFVALSSVWLFVAIMCAAAIWNDRRGRRDEQERAENFAASVRYARAQQRRAAQNSGSWRRPFES